MLGKPLLETYWWSYSAEVQEQLRDAINKAARGQRIRYDVPIRLSEGRFITIDFTLVPAFDHTGNIAYLIYSGRDITERKRAEQALRESEAKTRAILNTAVDGIITIDERGVIESFNPAAERIFGYVVEEVVGRNISILMPSPYREEHDTYVGNYLRPRQAKIIGIGREVTGQRKDGALFPMELSMSEVPLGDRRLFTGIVRDISDRKSAEMQITTSLKEKEVLLREIHHRVKNNLQIIYSLLDLQTGYVDDPGVLAMFRESQRRVKSMAFIHQKLYQSKDLAKIDFSEYARSLVEELLSVYGSQAEGVTLHFDMESIPFELNAAISCGLILNELVSNAFKHAFPNGRVGNLTVRLHQDQSHGVTLAIYNDGAAFPSHIDFRNTTSLGLQLVNLLTEQLGGTIDLQVQDETCFTIQFPLLSGV